MEQFHFDENEMGMAELSLAEQMRKYIQEIIDYRTTLLMELSAMESEVHRINRMMEKMGYE